MELIGEPGWRFEEGEKAALALEDLLGTYGIRVTPGSYLEGHILQSMRVAAAHAGKQSIDDDVRPFFRSLIGIYEIARLVLAVRQHPSFPSLVGHLRLLNEGNALQLSQSTGRDSATNKLFEMLIAVLAMQCGTDVELDDPVASAGDNPDVLATIGGSRWGFACKVLHSTHPEGFLDHLRKGVAQIERSTATVGVVVFNLKNVIDHNALWPLRPIDGTDEEGPSAWPNKETAFSALNHSMDEIGRRLRNHVDDAPGELAKIFAGTKSIPAFLLWGHLVTGVVVGAQGVPSSIRCMKGVRVGSIGPEETKALECLTWAAQSDSPSRGERPTA